MPEALLGIEKTILEKKVHAIVVGPFRSEALVASMDLVAKYKVPMLGTIAMTPVSEKKVLEDPEKYKYVFRVCLNSSYMAGYLTGTMGFIAKELGFKKAFFLVQDVLWARGTASGIEAWFKKEGWEVLGMETFPTGASDFSSALLKVQATGAQVIVMIFDMPTVGILIKQWKDMKVPALMTGVSTVTAPSAWKMSEGKIEGSINTILEVGSSMAVRKMPKSVEFIEAFKKRWGADMESNHGPAPSYDSIYILAEAIERAGFCCSGCHCGWAQKTDRMGVIGRIRFGKSQQVIYGNDPRETALGCMVQWKKGQRVVVYPESVAEEKIGLPPGLKPAK